MSEPAQEPGSPAVPAVTEPQAPSTTTTQEPANPAASTDDPTSPPWLPERLKKAESKGTEKVLKAAGVESEKDLRAKLQRLQELETASLSEQERTQKELERLSAIAGQHESLQKTFESVVNSEFSKLTEKQQEAIDAKASGDAQRRWEYMEFLRSTGALEASSAPSAPKPASTTAPGAAPPPAAPRNPQTPREIYEARKKTDPTGAALFYQMNSAAINSSPS